MLEGNLSDFTLPDILRLLAFTAKTGRLHIEGDRSHGRVDLVEGRVRDASADAQRLPLARRLIGLGHADGDALVPLLEGRDALPTDLELARELVQNNGFDHGLAAALLREQTVDAVFDLLRWNQGSFRFEMRSDADTSPPDLDLKVDDLLAEADQRLDAWPGIEQRTGAGSAVVTISRPSGGTPDIDPEGWALLALVDGHRTIDDLVSLSGRGQFDTRRTLGNLVELGVVNVGPPGRGGAVDKLISDHRALERVESSLQAFSPSGGSRAGGERPSPTAPVDRASEPVQPERPATSDAASPESSAARTPAGWQDDVPADLPPPTGAPSSPSLSVDEPAGRGHGRDAGAPPGESSSSREAAQASDPAQQRDDNLRMRVRSDRLTTDPSVDADLVSRLIDGVEGL